MFAVVKGTEEATGVVVVDAEGTDDRGGGAESVLAADFLGFLVEEEVVIAEAVVDVEVLGAEGA